MDNEKSNQNYVNLAFVIAGFLAYLVVNILLETLAGSFGAVARFRNIEIVKHGLPVTTGLVVFLALFLNKNVSTWADECIVELRKVVWPSKKDVTAMTMVVC